MDSALPRLLESHFGPESDPVDVAAFCTGAQARQGAAIASLESRWAQLSEETKSTLSNECSVNDMKNMLEETWLNPTVSSFLLKEHDHIVTSLNPKGKTRSSGRRAHLPAPDTLPPEVRALYDAPNGVKLSSWTLPLNAGIFVRTSRNSDYNAYETPKLEESSRCARISSQQAAVIVVSVYDRVPWSPCYVTRLSQLALISSQTLEDLCAAIPCAPYATRVASSPDNPIQNYAIVEDNTTTSGCVLCIEGLAYGDGKEGDYANKLMHHFTLASKSKTSIRKAPTTLGGTSLSSLSLRINEPYWMLHRGNCEHFIVVKQIRLLHPSDPRSGYPITLQQTSQTLHICRACTKSPAMWSIVGDLRLGESPSFLCAPCWEYMGLPEDPEVPRVEVIPLLAYVP